MAFMVMDLAQPAKPSLAIEGLIEKSAGKYCFGDQVTLADCFLVPQALSAQQRFGVDLKTLPTINRVVENLLALPEFDKALPKNQPDFQA
jgi:maleylacetoacetate isomerase